MRDKLSLYDKIMAGAVIHALADKPPAGAAYPDCGPGFRQLLRGNPPVVDVTPIALCCRKQADFKYDLLTDIGRLPVASQLSRTGSEKIWLEYDLTQSKAVSVVPARAVGCLVVRDDDHTRWQIEQWAANLGVDAREASSESGQLRRAVCESFLNDPLTKGPAGPYSFLSGIIVRECEQWQPTLWGSFSLLTDRDGVPVTAPVTTCAHSGGLNIENLNDEPIFKASMTIELLPILLGLSCFNDQLLSRDTVSPGLARSHRRRYGPQPVPVHLFDFSADITSVLSGDSAEALCAAIRGDAVPV